MLRNEKKAQIIGWLLFVVCALLFLAAGVKNGDLLTLIGSLVFLLACIVFLIPLLSRDNDL